MQTEWFFMFSFVDDNQNSWRKFTNIFMIGVVDHDQKIYMIGPISKYTYLKIKLMNMVTKKFIRTKHIFWLQFENKFLSQFIIHVWNQLLHERKDEMMAKYLWGNILCRTFVVKKWRIGLPLNIKWIIVKVFPSGGLEGLPTKY